MIENALATRKKLAGFAWAILGGVVIWAFASLSTTRREPWDAMSYWVFFYPLSIAAAAGIAHRHPRHPAILALLVFESQFLAMGIRMGELGNLWPIGMVLFALIALPAIGLALLVAQRSPYRDDTGSPAE
jgi:hypothetical protein